MSGAFEFLLFSVDPSMIRPCVAAGMDGIIVDWECLGKDRRQVGADTEINRHTRKDLAHARACTEATVLCRVNNGPTTMPEIDRALEDGADEILLPMVRSPDEVERVLDHVGGRAGVGILVETLDAVSAAPELGRLPLARVYVGLNDLHIERHTANLFVSVADGTVERIRESFTVPFGFGGLTVPELGHPIPCLLLIGELARLDSAFSFLRRSFHRDIRGRDPAVELPRIREALRSAATRTPTEVERDRRDLALAIEAWDAHVAS